MAEDRIEESEPRFRKRRTRRKRKNFKHHKILYNLRWIFGGLAVGLPLLALLIFAAEYR